MEPQQHPQQQMQQQEQPNQDSSKSNFLCRPSSTRWTPTTDQVRILKELYYNNGIRSPSAEQIQRISARLRQYGKIEGKNVFYWFQNHKARERQKKRLTVDVAMQRGSAFGGGGWKLQDSIHNKYKSMISACVLAWVCSSSSPSPGLLGVGQTGSSGYGSFLMEKSFGMTQQDCSISGGGGDGAESISNNLGWAGVDSYSSMYTLCDRRTSINGAFKDEDDDEGGAPANGMETLPLFPMHDEDDVAKFCCSGKSNSAGDWHHSTGRYGTTYNDKINNGSSKTSLELTLNSYGHWMSPDSS